MSLPTFSNCPVRQTRLQSQKSLSGKKRWKMFKPFINRRVGVGRAYLSEWGVERVRISWSNLGPSFSAWRGSRRCRARPSKDRVLRRYFYIEILYDIDIISTIISLILAQSCKVTLYENVVNFRMGFRWKKFTKVCPTEYQNFSLNLTRNRSLKIDEISLGHLRQRRREKILVHDTERYYSFINRKER